MSIRTEPPETQPAHPQRIPGQVILFVDDDEALRTYACEALTEAGYRAIQAGGGREAFAVVRSQHVDLVITDLLMPEKDGFETILCLRKNFPGLQIAAVSGGDPALLSMAKRLGACSLLFKPFSANDLVAVADYVCWLGSHLESGGAGADADSAWET